MENYLKYIKNLGTLSENQLDFYEYTLNNYQKILTKTVSQIANEYGVGVSFIYNFFKKIGIKNLKEYIFFLGFNYSQQQIFNVSSCNNPKNELENHIDQMNKITLESNDLNFSLFYQQQQQIHQLVQDIHDYNMLFYIGLGYSKIAVEDFLGLFTYLDKNFYLINNMEPKYLSNFKKITNNSLVIIYSIRAINHQIINWVKKIRFDHPKAKIYLITTNINTSIASYCDTIIEIDNTLKRVDGLKIGMILSPLTAFVNFNNLLKTIYFSTYQDELIKSNSAFKEELESWRDDKLARK